jgi:GTP pyrophosphokinase
MTLATSPKYQAEFEKDLIEILYQIEHYYPNLDEAKREKIKRAFWFSEKAHQNQTRFSGEPYFIHLVAATKILLQIQPDLETICACLLHDVIEDTPITPDEIERRFGKRIRFLCEGVEKITKVRLQGKDRELESLRKLFVAMAKDVRVIFIKLSDRIHNLSTLDHVPAEKRTRIARESLQIYVPVADRLGIHEFKTQMEDLCFKNLNPEEYELLKNKEYL